MDQLLDKLELDSVVMARAEHVSCALGAELAILDLGSGMYYGLDEIGAEIWKLIEKPIKMRAVRDALLERYEVEPARCEADLIKLLAELHSRGLIRIVAGDS
jgi:hypothetical protein